MAVNTNHPINTYDLSLEQQINLLDSAPPPEQDEAPLFKLPKDALINTHLHNITLLQKSKSIEPKPMVLPAAYAPCTSSLNELQRVCIPLYLANGY